MVHKIPFLETYILPKVSAHAMMTTLQTFYVVLLTLYPRYHDAMMAMIQVTPCGYKEPLPQLSPHVMMAKIEEIPCHDSDTLLKVSPYATMPMMQEIPCRDTNPLPTTCHILILRWSCYMIDRKLPYT